MHPHIVTTEKVGRGKDGSLVIIASAVDRPIELAVVLSRAGGCIDQDVALSIAMGALRGVSHAHEHQITHGGIHPRSVLVDGKGVSKLGDFGLAFALASAAAQTGELELIAGLRGFAAPELEHGQEPDQSSDVYAAAALVSTLVWGQSPPPSSVRGALPEALHQALDTDRMRRYASGVELEGAVRKAISKDNLDIADATRVQSYIEGLGGPSAASLDADTEDFLASLDLSESTQDASRTPSIAGLDAALAGLAADFGGLEDSDLDLTSEPVSSVRSVSSALSSLDEEFADDDELTAVDNSTRHSSSQDELEEMIRSQPHPAVVASRATPKKRMATQPPADDYEGRDDTPLPVPRPFHQDHTYAMDLVERVGRETATSSPFEDTSDLPPAPSRYPALRWVGIIAFVLATLCAVAYTKTDFLKGAARDNETRKTEALEALEKLQPVPGQISLLSETEAAAVWLLVGRTPATSFPLSSAMVHELRIEHEGYNSLFFSVGASHWSGEGSAHKALVTATLVKSSTESPAALPAFPPIASPPLAPGGPGQGTIQIRSDPAGAEVWLLVGATPEMTLAGIEAGRDYEFKILKDGYKPALASFKAESWYLSGSKGPMRPSLQQKIVLEPQADGPGAGNPDKSLKPNTTPKKPNRRSRRKRGKKRKKR